MYVCADVMEFRGAGRKECPKKGGNDTNHQGKDAKCPGDLWPHKATVPTRHVSGTEQGGGSW